MMGGPAFQPVSFTGRDEEVSDADRHRQRYTTSHLAHDLARHFEGKLDPLRDWFPLSAGVAIAALSDHLKGPDQPFGQLSCSCHPNCGASMMLVLNRHTKAWAPVSGFFDIDRFMKDINVITDTARGRALSITQVALSFLRNFDEKKAPAGFTPLTLLKLFGFSMRERKGRAKGAQPERAEGWEFMWVSSMWFQDLWTYDFRRTEMCVIPYGTQQGEISFCAYNTGWGWRQIVENMHMVATTRDWYKERGRHAIYAGDRPISLPGALKRRLPVLPVQAEDGAAAAGCGSGCGCG
jgi:hypothetical protein